MELIIESVAWLYLVLRPWGDNAVTMPNDPKTYASVHRTQSEMDHLTCDIHPTPGTSLVSDVSKIRIRSYSRNEIKCT